MNAMELMRAATLLDQLMAAGTPFEWMKVPPLSPCKFGPWELKEDKQRALRGYYSGVNPPTDNWVLLRTRTGKRRPDVWMSVTPMELESQASHVAAAHGNVFIGGGGLGIVAWNCAMKDEVERVTIVERDASIINLLDYIVSKHKWPNWQKVEVIQGDVLKGEWVRSYDVALIDIWPKMGDMRIRADLQRIAKRMQAKQYAAWTLEMDFVTWLMESGIPVAAVKPEHWKTYSDAIGVPLIQPHSNMAQFAVQAVMQTVLPDRMSGLFGPGPAKLDGAGLPSHDMIVLE